MVFIGSSSEADAIARSFQAELQLVTRCQGQVWSQGLFQPGRYTMENLLSAARRADFAVLIVTPDDLVTSRDTTQPAPRDNVIFELGLFMGVLSRERVYMAVDVTDGPPKLPTDLLGITWEGYRRPSGANWRPAVGPAALAIGGMIGAHGLRDHGQGLAPDNAGRALAREIDRICSDALAQGWKIKTNSSTTLRLESPRGHRHTFSIGEPSSSRNRLRPFAAALKADGLRVNQSVRRHPEDAPVFL